ncbi:predicted protein [Chaetomium globosum CBS 148.51]|uniref:Uncharacterized protein n=1 Tax=Chaetomium globosum (strain ATCC 6205 / CBS 148.51 / DSM 1962 / NBRC 6347 / NRRL 1970) TaxID=306901 RepID=Q2H5V3_CHAGB|nr:uncharacterized protein CHGG_05962 [Chaetomium globosum CBS 148.51]EAQ89343.1 predicted protein [Chaetomium globosum CBS 148.51]
MNNFVRLNRRGTESVTRVFEFRQAPSTTGFHRCSNYRNLPTNTKYCVRILRTNVFTPELSSYRVAARHRETVCAAVTERCATGDHGAPGIMQQEENAFRLQSHQKQGYGSLARSTPCKPTASK